MPEQCGRGRQRRINRELADLRIKGAGNGRQKVEKRYYSDGAAAGKPCNRAQDQDIYWHGGQKKRG
jgi:hypothetical protein